MTTATAGETDELLRDALDRLDRQERRTDALESALWQLGPTSARTPPPIAWPMRRLERTVVGDRPPPISDRTLELEVKLAAAEERLAEAASQLAGARRLETLGRLAAGVAHDFNNLLTVIGGHAELLCDLLPANDPRRDPVNAIVAAAHTAAGISRQLVAFGKPTAGTPTLVDANTAVRILERTLRRLAGDRVDLDILLASGVPAIHVDPGQFDQVVLNLVVNAGDAIPEAGAVSVRTAVAIVGPDRRDWPTDRSPGEYVVLTVTDTGVGMSDEVKSRMFDPFFTTKGPKGTGLGLATVRDVVRNAGGHVEVESQPEWGTSVRVFWPSAASPPLTPAPVTVTRSNAPGRGETLLLVQDGDALRDVAALALQLAGYRVLEAGDGDIGEERARLYAGPIDLLVTDVGLPRRDGRELAAVVRSARPDVKVLYLSGAEPAAGIEGPFLAKPYAPADLLAAVRRVLDESR